MAASALLGKPVRWGYPLGMSYRITLLLLIVFAFAGTQAWAVPVTGGASVDEPAALALMALGVAGLVIGRKVAKRRD